MLKNELFVNSGLVVRSTETRGYGVFTTKFIQSGSIIEECVVSEEIIRRTIKPFVELVSIAFFRFCL